jgi:hypothetical protein
MEMASFCLKIRHVFGFTWLTERSIGAGPPVIIQLSGFAVVTEEEIAKIKDDSIPKKPKQATKYGLKIFKILNFTCFYLEKNWLRAVSEI